jgi:hypothetical protein
MLPLDLGLAASGAQALFELFHLFHQVAHVRDARGPGCRFWNCAHDM